MKPTPQKQEALAVHYKAKCERLTEMVKHLTKSRNMAEMESRTWQRISTVLFFIAALSLAANILQLVNQFVK